MTPEKPIESRPGQAEADNRRNATNQDAIQDDLQGRLQAGFQGGIHGDIAGGVRGSVVSGIAPAVAGEIGRAVGQAIGTGVGVGIAVAHELGASHVAGDKDHDQDKDEGSKGRTRDPRTVAALMEALKDSDKDVRETASRCLRSHAPEIERDLHRRRHDLSQPGGSSGGAP